MPKLARSVPLLAVVAATVTCVASLPPRPPSVEPVASAKAAQGTSEPPSGAVLVADEASNTDLGPQLVKLWGAPPSVEAFYAVPVAAGVAPMDAARGAACPELAVSHA